MNLNKALNILAVFLFFTSGISSHSCSNQNQNHECSPDDNELLFSNIYCIPDIIRSYENIKIKYGRNNILFFRYVNSSCNVCRDKILKELLLFQEEIGKENVWIFPAYPDDRKSRILLSADLEKFNYVNIHRDSLYIPIYDGEEKSYFAWINNDGEIDMVFFPDKDKAQYTKKYFFEVRKLLQATKEIEK